MSARAEAIDSHEFTVMFFTILIESEQDEGFDKDRLYDYCMAHFDGDQRKTDSFMHRFFNLLHLSEHAEARPYLRRDDSQIRFHPALMETAATLRTRNNGSFPDRRFFAEVRRLADSRYRDFSFDDASAPLP